MLLATACLRIAPLGPTCATCLPVVYHLAGDRQPHYELHTHTGAWAPRVVVEVVTRFARRLSHDVAWPEIQELLVLINQVPAHLSVCSDL